MKSLRYIYWNPQQLLLVDVVMVGLQLFQTPHPKFLKKYPLHADSMLDHLIQLEDLHVTCKLSTDVDL